MSKKERQNASPGMKTPAATRKKIDKLGEMARQLSEGNYFSITRLTVLKSLCQDPETANRFVFYLAQRTFDKMTGEEPSHIERRKWERHKAVVRTALEHMEAYLKNDAQEEKDALRDSRHQLEQLQNTYRHQEWGPVRIVESSKTLLVEQALECLLSPKDSGFWGYRTGRTYAERYNSRYGAGLVPESAPMLEDIVEFWHRSYAG